MAKKKSKRNKRGYYTIKGKDHVSVTTYQRVINKPFLMPWYGRMEQKAVLKILKKFKWETSATNNAKEILKAIKKLVSREDTAADRYIMKRGKRGNEIHKAIQVFLKSGKKPKLKHPKSKKAFKNFLKWWPTSGYKALKVEKVVSDKKKGVAGTLDVYLLRIKDKKKGIGDWKTGKNIYDEHHMQNQVYRYLGRKKYPSDFGILIHVPQDGGPVKEHKVNTKKFPLELCWHALALYRGLHES